MRRLLLAASASLALAVAPAVADPSPPRHLPPGLWIDMLETSPPDTAIWLYISGLVNGAITGSLASTSGAQKLICGAHDPMSDVEMTRQILLAYLVTADLVDNDKAILEVVVPLAFAWAYPCGIAT